MRHSKDWFIAEVLQWAAYTIKDEVVFQEVIAQRKMRKQKAALVVQALEHQEH